MFQEEASCGDSKRTYRSLEVYRQRCIRPLSGWIKVWYRDKKKDKNLSKFNCSNVCEPVLSLPCADKGNQSKSLQKETLISTCLKSFLSVVVSSPSLLSRPLLGMLKITFSSVLPLSVLFHVVNMDFSLPVSYRPSASSAFPVYFLVKGIIGDIAPSLEIRGFLLFLATCCSVWYYIDFASYQIWHIC